ncbi:hypothetical protein OEZ85_012271 [Tetradesmus obliquus]|uniref:Uncharacterized protein n=1 Tax=Tetradesmus obliquus TaxID=3088 RepID=A0ABY8TSU7_TETOB|nr:hypothetical protein OEZ85_012271 [Tetradesmus obliquus]
MRAQAVCELYKSFSPEPPATDTGYRKQLLQSAKANTVFMSSKPTLTSVAFFLCCKSPARPASGATVSGDAYRKRAYRAHACFTALRMEPPATTPRPAAGGSRSGKEPRAPRSAAGGGGGGSSGASGSGGGKKRTRADAAEASGSGKEQPTAADAAGAANRPPAGRVRLIALAAHVNERGVFLVGQQTVWVGVIAKKHWAAPLKGRLVMECWLQSTAEPSDRRGSPTPMFAADTPYVIDRQDLVAENVSRAVVASGWAPTLGKGGKVTEEVAACMQVAGDAPGGGAEAEAVAAEVLRGLGTQGDDAARGGGDALARQLLAGQAEILAVMKDLVKAVKSRHA